MIPEDPGQQQDTLPRIDLRLLTPWQGVRELMDDLAGKAPNYELTEHALVHLRTGNQFRWEVSARDEEIVDLFRHSGRCSEEEMRAIEKYACKFHISHPGGSVSTARSIFDAATALVRAGAVGV